jgi:hypothetical protein
MIFLAMIATICALVVAALFWVMWCDEDFVTSAALAFALLPVLMLALMAWRVAL